MPDFTEPLETEYGHVVKLGHSSAAMYDGMWMWVDSEKSETKRAQDGFDGTISVHMNLEQVVALRDRLTAWIAVVRGYDDMLVVALRAQIQSLQQELTTAADGLARWATPED